MIDATLTLMAAWTSLTGVVILAGGSSRRMGTDKLLLRRHGVSLIDTVIQGVRQELRAHSCPARIIIVGPPRTRTPESRSDDVLVIQETPPGSGPLSAIAASLNYLADRTPLNSLIGVLAGDAPRGPEALSPLMDGLAVGGDASVLVDTDGRRQPLCAVYRVAPLQQALSDIGDPVDRSLGDLLDRLTVTAVRDTVDAAVDIDTPAQAHHLGFTEK